MEKVKTFQVKEVCKICNVTRKALLIYEEKGLLTPYYVNEETGYRYYNAENLSQLMHIRKLQSFGFSLDEIYDYLHDTKTFSEVFDRLSALKKDLEEILDQMHLRMMTEEYDHQEILSVPLPRCCYFASRKTTHGYLEALNFLRETHLAAIKTGRADKTAKMLTAVLSFEGDYPDVYGTCEMLYCIPMVGDYDGENAVVLEETDALTLLHRGPYTTLIDSIKRMMDHCKANGIEPTGPMRLLWLEGPPIHGAQEEGYLTQIVVPIGK